MRLRAVVKLGSLLTLTLSLCMPLMAAPTVGSSSLRNAAAAGNPEAMSQMALQLVERTSDEDIADLEMLVAKGNPLAKFLLADYLAPQRGRLIDAGRASSLRYDALKEDNDGVVHYLVMRQQGSRPDASTKVNLLMESGKRGYVPAYREAAVVYLSPDLDSERRPLMGQAQNALFKGLNAAKRDVEASHPFDTPERKRTREVELKIYEQMWAEFSAVMDQYNKEQSAKANAAYQRERALERMWQGLLNARGGGSGGGFTGRGTDDPTGGIYGGIHGIGGVIDQQRAQEKLWREEREREEQRRNSGRLIRNP